MKIVFLIAALEVIALSMWAVVRSGKRRSKVPMAPLESSLANTLKSPRPDSLDALHWAYMNEWHLEGQADDRRPMHGTVGDSTGSPSARRSIARRSHLSMCKEWSKTRHE